MLTSWPQKLVNFDLQTRNPVKVCSDQADANAKIISIAFFFRTAHLL